MATFRVTAVLRRGALASFVVAVSACTPIWPRMMTDHELHFRDNTTSLRCDDRLTDVTAARNCLNAAREEMHRHLAQIGYYYRALGYGALVLGTAAGYQAAKSSPNTGVIKRFGIALAALIGLDKVTGADAEHDALDAGIKALDCIDQAASAAKTGAKGLALTSIQTLSDLARKRTANIAIPTYRTFLESQLSASLLFRNAARRDLDAALADAADDEKLAGRIRISVVRIRATVQAQTSGKKADLQQIFKEQQQRVSDMVGQVVNAGRDVRAATGAVEANLLAISLAEEHKADKDPAVEEAKTLLVAELAKANDGTAPATDAFETCVAPIKK